MMLTEKAYQAAMVLIHDLMALDPEADSPEGHTLRTLATWVEAYEKATYPDLRG